MRLKKRWPGLALLLQKRQLTLQARENPGGFRLREGPGQTVAGGRHGRNPFRRFSGRVIHTIHRTIHITA